MVGGCALNKLMEFILLIAQLLVLYLFDSSCLFFIYFLQPGGKLFITRLLSLDDILDRVTHAKALLLDIALLFSYEFT